MLLLICSCHAGVALRWRDTPLNFVKQLSLHNSKLLWLKKIIWVTGILRRTFAGDWRFDNLCRGHLQSQDVFATGCWNVSRQTTVLLKTPVTEVIFFNQVYVTPGFKSFSYHDSKFFFDFTFACCFFHGIFLRLPILLNWKTGKRLEIMKFISPIRHFEENWLYMHVKLSLKQGSQALFV